MDTFLNRKCMQIHNLNSWGGGGGGGGKKEKKKLKLIQEKNGAQQLHWNFKNGENEQMFKSNSILSNFWKDSMLELFANHAPKEYDVYLLC